MVTPISKFFDANTIKTNLDNEKINFCLGIDIFPIDGIQKNKIANYFFYLKQHINVKIFSILRACEFNNI